MTAQTGSRWVAGFAVLLVVWARCEPPGDGLGPAGMDSYDQTVVVTFRTTALAHEAQIRMAPLYHDLQAAFSTRMDDCNLNNLRVAAVMAQHGQKGTFFLNRPTAWWQDSAALGIALRPGRDAGIANGLLIGGNSIGDHTLNHEMLPVLNKNAAFREILGARVALESWSASPVVAFAYPDLDYISGWRDGSDRVDLEEMLRRSGIYQVAEHRYNAGWDSELQDALFVVCDNAGGGPYSPDVMTDPSILSQHPLFLVTMHALVGAWGGPSFPVLADWYRRWSNRKHWWYCNSNEYAAYRYEYLHSRLAAFPQGRILRVVLRRPSPLDLGDWSPLTFRIDGVPADAIESVESPAARTQRVPLADSYGFDLFHDQSFGPIQAYGETDNRLNSHSLPGPGAALEGLRAVLWNRGSWLQLLLLNGGPDALSKFRIRFRLPLRWRDGICEREIPLLRPGESGVIQLPLTERSNDSIYRDGVEYDVAQVDFVGHQRDRLYAVCETAAQPLPEQYPRNGFLVLGPLAGDIVGFDAGQFAAGFLSGDEPRASYAVPWGSLRWHASEPIRSALLDGNMIPTAGSAFAPDYCTWDPVIHFAHMDVRYLLYGYIYCPEVRIVRVIVPPGSVERMTVNGRVASGPQVRLKRGLNDFRVLFAPAGGLSHSRYVRDILSRVNENNYGCYFRLVSLAGKSMADLRFERPALP